MDVSVEEAERRDPKGLYKRARRGEVKDFTGVSANAPYEAPEEAEVRVRTGEMGVEECVGVVLEALEKRGLLRKGEVQEGGLVEG